MRTPILLSLVLLLLLTVTADADVNLFTGKELLSYSSSEESDIHVMREKCEGGDDVCHHMDLELFSLMEGRKQLLPLVLRFSLSLRNGTCFFFRTEGQTIALWYTSLMMCLPSRERGARKPKKQFSGTFFRDQSRYEISGERMTIRKADFGQRNMGQSRSITPELVQEADRSLADFQHWVNTPRPKFTQPTIELVFGIDHSFSRFFAEDEEQVIKFVAQVFLVVETAFNNLEKGLRVKLAGVRFWQKFGFNDEGNSELVSHFKRLSLFIDRQMIDLSTEAIPRRVRGVPDAIVTLSHTGINNSSAVNRHSLFMTNGHIIIQPIFGSKAVTGYPKPSDLSPYTTGMIVSHAIGHVLSLEHATEGVGGKGRECFKPHGDCIMSSSDSWRLPLWTKEESDFIEVSANEGQVNQFLMTKDVDTGMEEKPAPKRTAATVLVVLLVFSVLFAIVVLNLFFLWRNTSE